MSFSLLSIRIWSSCFLCIWFKKICNWLIIFCLCDVTFFRSLKWLCPNFLVTPMLSGLSKRILMVMFTLFTETNVGPCTIHHGANVGNSKTSLLTNIWMLENFEKKSSTKNTNQIFVFTSSWKTENRYFLFVGTLDLRCLHCKNVIKVNDPWNFVNWKDYKLVSLPSFTIAGTHEIEQF